MQVYCFYILDTARGGCRDTDRSLHVSLSRFLSPTPSPLTCSPIQCLENPLFSFLKPPILPVSMAAPLPGRPP